MLQNGLTRMYRRGLQIKLLNLSICRTSDAIIIISTVVTDGHGNISLVVTTICSCSEIIEGDFWASRLNSGLSFVLYYIYNQQECINIINNQGYLLSKQYVFASFFSFPVTMNNIITFLSKTGFSSC